MTSSTHVVGFCRPLPTKMVHVRVRLRFDSSPLHYAKKCWFVFDADQCSLVKDVAYLIARQFGLTQGIQLYMDDFLIPVNESAHVIRDNDLIRVAAVECESSNTVVVLSEEETEQSSKVKRRKTEKSGSQTSSTTSTGAVCAVAPKSSTTKTVKPLTKVGEPSNKSKSAGGQLKAVTRKSSSGALHITFQSSSSSESSSESESSSSSSSSDSSESDTTVAKNQRNSAVTRKVNIEKVASVIQTPSPSVKVTPASSNRSPATGANSGNRQSGVNANRRGRRRRKKTLSTNVTVGGGHDVLTTKSTLYKSPVLNKKSPGTNSKPESIASNNSQSSGTAANMAKTMTVHTTNTNTGGKETKKRISQWDVQPAAVGLSQPVITAVNSASDSTQPPVAEQPVLPPPRDYSTLPDLQGPPRQGDKLAFRVLEMSSSYTPVISEYKEATVLGFDPTSKLIQVEYTEETLMRLKRSKERGKPGKFELQMDPGEEDEGEPQVLEKSVEIILDTLIEPKLVT